MRALTLWSCADRFGLEARAGERGGLGGPRRSEQSVSVVRTPPPPMFVSGLREKVRPDRATDLYRPVLDGFRSSDSAVLTDADSLRVGVGDALISLSLSVY
jgi:hypothetical protein